MAWVEAYDSTILQLYNLQFAQCNILAILSWRCSEQLLQKYLSDGLWFHHVYHKVDRRAWQVGEKCCISLHSWNPPLLGIKAFEVNQDQSQIVLWTERNPRPPNIWGKQSLHVHIISLTKIFIQSAVCGLSNPMTPIKCIAELYTLIAEIKFLEAKQGFQMFCISYKSDDFNFSSLMSLYCPKYLTYMLLTYLYPKPFHY